MQSDMTTNLQMTGNAALLGLPDKVAFLSSRRISAADVLKCYEWAEKIRDTETCVIGGFQSPLEKDVLKFLLRGKVPIILVLARSLWKTIPEELPPLRGWVKPDMAGFISYLTYGRNIHCESCSGSVVRVADIIPLSTPANLIEVGRGAMI